MREITPETVFEAYRQGYFPMGDDNGKIDWYRPYRRALFPIEGVHVSKSLAKTIRRGVFEIRFDTEFETVMRSCLRPEENWITEDIICCYTEIHRQGWGHCCECWSDGRLVGGVYGIALGGCFCSESMFHRETDASKVALANLVPRCRDLGFTIFDAQIMNPHLRSLGAYEVSHREYMEQLTQAIDLPTAWSAVAVR